MWAASHKPHQVTNIRPHGQAAAPPPGTPALGVLHQGDPLTSPRPYVAAAAASLLAAVYFVPSASASPDHDASAAKPATSTSRSAHHLGLADTGSIDTKPYVVGGAAFLVAGAGLILNASRRSRQTL